MRFDTRLGASVEGGALETVMELDDAVATPGLKPTNTTWAQVRAAGQAKAAAQHNHTRDIEGSVLSVNRVDVAGQALRFEAPARQRGYQMEWYKLDGSGNGSMSHDGAGRVTAEFNRTYTYDDFHSLVRAGAASGNNAQAFQYDAVGRLIAVRRGTAGWPVEEELAYDGTQMVAAWNGAGVATWSALWGQGVDNLISVKPAPDGAEVMALKDGRGSVVGYYQAEATPQGLLATADYTPEGRVTSKDWVTGTTCTETGSTQCPRLGGLPFGFHGAYKSPAHGLLYFRNRWYSAEAGQWLTQDPLGEVDSVNLYAFNRFDSVNFIDPFGLSGKGAATQGTFVICREPDGYTCGPNGRAAREEAAREKAAAEAASLKAEQDWQRRNQAPKQSDPTEPARSAATKVAAFMGGAATGVLQTVTPGAAFVPLKPTGDKAFDVGKNVALIVTGAYLMATGIQGMAAGAGGEALPVVGQVAGTAAVAASAAVAAQGLAAAGQGVQGLAAAMSGNGSSGGNSADHESDDRGNQSESQKGERPISEDFDLDDAAETAFGEGAKVVDTPVKDFGPVKNPEIRAKIEALGYKANDFTAKSYEVLKPDSKTYDRVGVYESGSGDGKVYLGAHPSSSAWKP